MEKRRVHNCYISDISKFEREAVAKSVSMIAKFFEANVVKTHCGYICKVELSVTRLNC